MSVVAIIQARMTSSRLPGKVLMDIEGIPMIGRQIERIKEAKLIDDLIVATSTDASDDTLAKYAESLGVNVQRGPLDDVLQRFIEVLDSTKAENFVRLTADCPLADPQIIDDAIKLFLDSNCDYVSNTVERTYPRGLDVEVAKSKVLRSVAKNSFDPVAREHVTQGIYSQPENYSLASLKQNESHAKFRWTVDNSEDMAFAQNVYRYFLPRNRRFRQQDVLDWLKEFPENAHFESSVGK